MVAMDTAFNFKQGSVTNPFSCHPCYTDILKRTKYPATDARDDHEDHAAT